MKDFSTLNIAFDEGAMLLRGQDLSLDVKKR